MNFQVQQSATEQWRFVINGDDGALIATSETFDYHDECLDAIEQIKLGAFDAPVSGLQANEQGAPPPAPALTAEEEEHEAGLHKVAVIGCPMCAAQAS